MRRSTALAKAVKEAIDLLSEAEKLAEAKSVGVLLTTALVAYRARPEGEPEVKAKAKAEG